MSPNFGTKTLTSMLSIATIGVALSFGTGTALAQVKNVTEGDILRALAPEKKPLTRGLSTGPQQVDQVASAAEGTKLNCASVWKTDTVNGVPAT